MSGGATLGDAAIALIAFARDDPLIFLLTVPLAGAVALALCAFMLKVVVIGPLTGHRKEYEDRRREGREPREPRLPL